MAAYDKQVLQSYFDNYDYLGAAEYLSKYNAATPELQDKLYKKIDELRIRGEREKGIVQTLYDTRDQDAYRFYEVFSTTGTIPSSINSDKGNIVGDEYLNYLDNLKVSDGVIHREKGDITGNEIKNIRLDLFNDDSFAILCKQLGTTNSDIRDLGVKLNKDSKNGHYYIDIPTKSNRLYDILEAARSIWGDIAVGGTTGDNNYIWRNGQKEISSYRGFDTYQNKDTKYGMNLAPFNIFGVDDDGNVVRTQDFNYGNIQRAYQLYDNAKNINLQTLRKQETTEFDESLHVTPFLGIGQANAYKALSKGLISQQTYDRTVKQLTEYYDRMLKMTSLAGKKVYMTNDVSGSTPLELVNDNEKILVKRALLAAINDKRCTYGAGMLNGQVGTFILIDEDLDSKNNVISNEISKGRAIFVPGLFQSSAQEAYESSTETMAIRDKADMKRWNYGKFLQSGEYYGYDKELGAYTLDNETQIKIPVTEDRLLKELNKDIAIRQSISQLTQYVDREGKPLLHDVDGEMKPYDIESLANEVANHIVANLYPSGSIPDGIRLEQQADIFALIIKGFYNNVYLSKSGANKTN